MPKSSDRTDATERFYTAEVRSDGGTFIKAAVATALVALASLVVRRPPRVDDDVLPEDLAPVRLDRDMQRTLDALAILAGESIATPGPDEARARPGMSDAVTALLAARGRDAAPLRGVTALDRTLAGPASWLPARVYTPDGSGPFPVVVYFHGGVWTTGDLDRYDASARGLAKAARAIVVSVHCRRAPEAKFPAAWEDALAAYAWAASNAATFGGDPQRLALAGEGAGGTLAVATAIAARDAGLRAPRHVLAIHPVAQVTDLLTDSYVDSANARPLDKATMRWSLQQLVSRPDDRRDSRLDLVHADLAGLPPVTIINAQSDPLRVDGAMLETALKAADGIVERKVYPGVTHDFFGAAAVVAKAQDAQALAGLALRRAFR